MRVGLTEICQSEVWKLAVCWNELIKGSSGIEKITIYRHRDETHNTNIQNMYAIIEAIL